MSGQHDNEADDPGRCRVDGAPAARECAIATLARRQHGVLVRAQLRSLGLSADVIDYRAKHGRLTVLHRGVYLVGPVTAPLTAAMAAVLACGEEAVLSHRGAAIVWQLLAAPGRPAELDVTVPARNPGAKRGVRVHRVAALDPRDVRTRYAVPITGPARTLLDVAAGASAAELEQALAEAYSRRLVRRGEVASVVARYLRHPGRTSLQALLEADASPARLRSQAERRFLDLARKGRLPPPEANVRIGRYEIDFLWREARLAVEVDGFRFHSSQPAFERDRLRDAELLAQGYRVMRVTWRQMTREPEAVLVRLARLLGEP